jgi:hypothetical protein
MWVVPGAPLEEGNGWRIWYSQAGVNDFTPAPVQVFRGSAEEQVDQPWRLMDALPGLNQRMGTRTVMLRSPSPGTQYRIWIPEVSVDVPLFWQSFPTALGAGVTFLFASCFWRPDDKEGAYSAAIRQLHKLFSPAFKLLVGDQIYLDWPSAPPRPKTSLELYADRYAEYWGDPAYQEVLLSSPNFFLCDDHEFWNDYPERQVHLARTWGSSQQEHAQAATALYERFQRVANPGAHPWYRFDIEPVSFFVADTRSERDQWGENCHFFQDQQWADLERWVRELHGPGVLVLGQPLFQKDGDWKDHSLSNFSSDYGRLCHLIENSLRGHNNDGKRHDILILSGDIHVGRYCVGRIAGLDGIEVGEFIASPASRVGPHLREPSPDDPPTKFRAQHAGRITTWNVEQSKTPTTPTIHNNVGIVRMAPGTNGRVRFELTLWQVRPHTNRSFWQRTRNERQPQGDIIELFRTELQLG